MFAAIPETPKADATRNTGAVALQGIAKTCPLYVSGSADLHGSNKNYIKGGGDFGSPEMPPGGGKTYAGRNIHYGIREHAMGSIMNGIAYYGLFRTSGATFLVFADYAKATKNGKPKMIICKTIIAKGIDAVAGNNAGHGE